MKRIDASVLLQVARRRRTRDQLLAHSSIDAQPYLRRGVGRSMMEYQTAFVTIHLDAVAVPVAVAIGDSGTQDGAAVQLSHDVDAILRGCGLGGLSIQRAA